MSSKEAMWGKALVDFAIDPARDVISSFTKFLRFYSSQSDRNTSSTLFNVEMTPNELELFFLFKLIWSLVMAILIVLALGVSINLLYKFFFVPYERIRRLGSIGYLNGESDGISKKDLANLIRRRRKIGEDLPPVYPNGWFHLLDSLQLQKGEVKEVCALGEHFAVFRSQSGKANVLDAYCPHMGGNLAVGGLVKGECLECPFHGWVFDDAGLCVKIPYSEKVPNFAKTKSWLSKEVNGSIFVWYHCDGVAPEWEIPEVAEISGGRYKYRGRVEHHVNTHIQDLPENGSDQAHLSHLHIPCVTAGNDLSKQFDSWFNIAKHIFKADCLGSPKDQPHISKIKLTHCVELFNRWKFLELDFNVFQIGPGMVHLHFTSTFGPGVFVQTLTPVEPLHQVMTHKLYTTWKIPNWVGRFFLLGEAIQVDRDVMIWNNKTFRPRPKLVKEDKLISQYRRWFAQFYTENSPRLSMKSDGDLQW